jgi:hypothetical protein
MHVAITSLMLSLYSAHVKRICVSTFRPFMDQCDSDVQQISKRSCSSSSEEVEVEECLPEEPDSDGLDSGGLDTDHSFCQEARAIIPRIKVETRSYRF